MQPAASAATGGTITGLDYLALLEDAVAARQEAVRMLERLLAGQHTLSELTFARQRVERRAATSERLRARVERASSMRR